jgi:tetratricopeptide (TPR) repeat protein
LKNLAQAPDTRDAAHYLLRIERAEALTALGRLPEARATLAEAGPLVSELDEDPDKYDTIALNLAEVGIDLAERNLEGAQLKAADALARMRASSRRQDLWHLEDTVQRRLANVELAAGNKPAACAALDEAIRLRSANALPTDPRLAAARKLRTSCT